LSSSFENIQRENDDVPFGKNRRGLHNNCLGTKRDFKGEGAMIWKINK